MRVSCEYRSCLRSACMGLQESAGKGTPNADKLLSMYETAELVWSLTELLFIRPPGLLVYLFVEYCKALNIPPIKESSLFDTLIIVLSLEGKIYTLIPETKILRMV